MSLDVMPIVKSTVPANISPEQTRSMHLVWQDELLSRCTNDDEGDDVFGGGFKGSFYPPNYSRARQNARIPDKRLRVLPQFARS